MLKFYFVVILFTGILSLIVPQFTNLFVVIGVLVIIATNKVATIIILSVGIIGILWLIAVNLFI